MSTDKKAAIIYVVSMAVALLIFFSLVLVTSAMQPLPTATPTTDITVSQYQINLTSTSDARMGRIISSAATLVGPTRTPNN